MTEIIQIQISVAIFWVQKMAAGEEESKLNPCNRNGPSTQ